MRIEEEYVSREEMKERLLKEDPSLSINTEYMTVLLTIEVVRRTKEIWEKVMREFSDLPSK
jgi:hypothetical protein